MVGRGPASGRTREEAIANAPIQVELVYRPHGNTTANLVLQIIRETPSGGYTFPESAAQSMRVNGIDAVYVQGVWDEHGQWNPRVDASALSWTANEFTYTLRAYALSLDREDMIRIAESIR